MSDALFKQSLLDEFESIRLKHDELTVCYELIQPGVILNRYIGQLNSLDSVVSILELRQAFFRQLKQKNKAFHYILDLSQLQTSGYRYFREFVRQRKYYPETPPENLVLSIQCLKVKSLLMQTILRSIEIMSLLPRVRFSLKVHDDLDSALNDIQKMVRFRDVSISALNRKMETVMMKMITNPDFEPDLISAPQIHPTQQGLVDVVNLLQHEMRLLLDQLQVEIDERKQAETEALDANRLKSRFLAYITHELRTPLNGVVGVAELLGYTELSERQQDYLSIIRESADSMLHMLNNVLDFSKIEASGIQPQYLPTDLQALVEKSVGLFKPNSEKKGLAFNTEFQLPASGFMMIDPVMLQQIIWNLLSNAIKFTEQGQIDFKVACLPHSQPEYQTLLIEIKDTGPGIEPAVQTQILQPFYQVGDANLTTTKGSGLGLTICGLLIEALQGELQFTSTPGKGSCFWFELPIKQLVN